jgi:hypothetical protein
MEELFGANTRWSLDLFLKGMGTAFHERIKEEDMYS